MRHVIKGFDLNRSGVDPDAVAAEVRKLLAAHDGITPDILLETARKKTNPLHPLFDWDDSVAAEKWRTHQARKLARAIHVIPQEVERPEPRPIMVRTENVYRSVETVVAREDWYLQAMRQLHAKVSQAEQAVRQLREAAEQHHPDDVDRLAKINVALEAFRACSRAVDALH